MVLFLLSLAWILGVFAGTFFDLPSALLLLALAPLPFCFVRRHRRTSIIAILCLCLFLGASFYSHSSFETTDLDLCSWNDLGTMELEGKVVSDPDVRDTGTRLEVDITRLMFEGEARDVEGRALVFVSRYPERRYGDVLRITGEPQTPAVLEDFDYRNYLEHQGIDTVMYYPRVEIIEAGQGNPVMAWIYSVRERLADSLSEALPEPQASLAQGMLLGIRSNIPQDVREDFNRSGTAHLLAISGLHLGIVAGMLLAAGIAVFGRRRGVYIWVALAGIWVYAVMTGLNPPVVRGAVMASMFLMAEGLGRQRSGLVALVVAAAVMVGNEPYILGDASFQLSFLAMAGLIGVYPLLRDAGRWLAARLLGEDRATAALSVFVIDTLSATLAATLAVWPVVAYYFGIVALAGPLTTFLALPALAGIIVFSGLAAIFGLALPVIGQAFGWIAWLFLSWVLAAAGWLGSEASLTINIDSLHPGFLWAYYICGAGIVWLVFRWRRRRDLAAGASGQMKAGIAAGFLTPVGWKWALVPLALAAVLVVTVAVSLPDNRVTVSFLDVGQGDAILVRQGTTQVLIDGGPAPQQVINRLGERMPFWDRTIEAVVLTHPHGDHLAGLVEVLRRYEVKQVVVAPGEYDSTLYREWQRVIEETGIPVSVVVSGHRLDIGNVSIEVLHPGPGAVEAGDETVLVLRLDVGETSFLLTADIPGKVERELVRGRADLDADVLKAAHHGSDDSSTAAFLSVVTPEVVVVSCGEGNRYGHPGPNALARLASVAGGNRIFRTDLDGSVDFLVEGNRLVVIPSGE